MTQLDAAYEERNKLVAFLAACFPSGIKKTNIPDWDDEWQNCVYIDTPAGQMSWHYHSRDSAMFRLPPYQGEWDGHTTEEKYARLEKLTKAIKVFGGVGSMYPEGYILK